MIKYISIFGIVAVFVIVAGVAQVKDAEATCQAQALVQTYFGMSGAAVTTLQECLMGAGYSIPAGATGYYGGQTRTAVQKFYAAKLGLPTWHGNSVGPMGRAMLGAAKVTPTTNTQPQTASGVCADTSLATAQFGVSGVAVTTLQECLMGAGYSIPAGATGYYGGQTRTAVQKFYAAKLGLPTWHGNFVGPQGRNTLGNISPTIQPVTGTSAAKNYKRVGSEKVLMQYLEAHGDIYTLQGVTNDAVFSTGEPAQGAPTTGLAPAPSAAREESDSATRVSETNVQVAGIDEPDSIKTDGHSIFYSKEGYHHYPQPLLTVTSTPVMDEVDAVPPATINVEGVEADIDGLYPYRETKNSTLVINASPLDELGIASEAIEERGELLLDKKSQTLVVLAYPDIVAYDVSNPEKPEQTWSHTLGDSARVYTARLTDDMLYLVTTTSFQTNRPCPVRPLSGTSIRCADILVPEYIEPLNQLFTILSVEPESGNIEKEVSVAAGGWNTVVAMFEDNMYLVSPSATAQYEALIDIILASAAPYMSEEVMQKAHTIASYDISASVKLSEIQLLIDTELQTMDVNERLRVQTEMQNTYAEEMQKRIRSMDRSRVVRVALPSLTLDASAEIPGKLLNQFSLDEHKGNLRVAVTVAGNRWGGGKSVNDVYVLDDNLNMVGSIQDLGIGERIYSVRFMGDVGYLVTFRQIDPFYVLDLSNPAAPKMTGELKIPGYSAYLEPLDDDLILGVGREDRQVKLSVFDVSNPARPIEKSKYILDEGWTEVEGNHHAFLRDPDYKVFFIPGGKGGYVFSYEDGKLSLKKTLAGHRVKRALFIDDYMYVVGEDSIRVLNETTWKQEAELSFLP